MWQLLSTDIRHSRRWRHWDVFSQQGPALNALSWKHSKIQAEAPCPGSQGWSVIALARIQDLRTLGRFRRLGFSTPWPLSENMLGGNPGYLQPHASPCILTDTRLALSSSPCSGASSTLLPLSEHPGDSHSHPS